MSAHSAERMKKALAVVGPATPSISFSWSWKPKLHFSRPLPKPSSELRRRFRLLSSSSREEVSQQLAYKNGLMDEVLLNVFRKKMVEEVGWDSDKPGYDGLIEVANRLMLNNPTNSDTKEAAVRVLISLFPPFLLQLYKLLVSPIQGGKIAALMVARVTTISCQWLMGRCAVNSVDLPDGSSWTSGVFVEKCKYLEESKCVGICVNTCKLPTQSFFKDYMGVPLLMEPNFIDYSCQFKFGVHPPLPEDDATLKEPCLDICPNATRRREIARNVNIQQCPKA